MNPFEISRRIFSRSAALATAATGLPPWFLAETLDATEPARTGR